MTIHLRAADFHPSTVGLEVRTVEAIAATGADVDRGSFIERLNLPGADLSPVNCAPALDTNKADSTRSILGVIDEHGPGSGGLWVRIHFRHTGQRYGDLIGLHRSEYDSEVIRLIQSKI